jgi:integrase/recombinase XerD
MFDRSGQRKYLTAREREAFRKTTGLETDLSRRAFLLTLFYTGCRISEALNLAVGQIDVEAGAVTFCRSGTG